MRRTRRSAANRAPIRERSDSSSSSDDDQPLSKKINRNSKKSQETSDTTETKNSPANKVQPKPNLDDSSSESDIETYLQPISKLDLNSSFFDPVTTTNKNQSSLPGNHKRQQIDTSNSSDSDDSSADVSNSKSQTMTVLETEPKKSLENEPVAGISRLNFQQLHDYTRKLEDTKKHVDEYNARQKLATTSTNSDIFNMLISGENKQTVSSGSPKKSQTTAEKFSLEDLHSSDFESCSSEDENDKDKWEVVKDPQKSSKDVAKVPKEGLQITVEMPGVIKQQKKRGQNDVMMAIKRRLNKIKKENQILIHKVHLLCWLAHGNHVNQILNSQIILATALSLLPSEKCYPEGRTDLKYLQQILTWFRNTVRNSDKGLDKKNTVDLATLLQIQMKNKEALDKKMWVLIFIAVLRALGIQCRLVLSLQVEPLRPPQSELCSLSTKNGEDKSKANKTGVKKASQKSVGDVAKKPNKTSLKLNDSKAKSAPVKNAKPPEKIVRDLGKNTVRKSAQKPDDKKVPSSSVPTNDPKSTRLRSAETTDVKNNGVSKQPGDDKKVPRKRPAVKVAGDEIVPESSQPPKKPKIVDSQSNKSSRRQSSRNVTTKTPNSTEKNNKTSQNRTRKAKVPQIDGLVDSQSSDSDSQIQISDLQLWQTDLQSSDSETEERLLDFRLVKTNRNSNKDARIPQLYSQWIHSEREDGVRFPPQLDGPTDSPQRMSARPKGKLNLKKLKLNEGEKKQEPPKTTEVPSKQRRSLASVPKYKDTDSSDDDFSTTPRSPFVRKSSLNNLSPAVNLKKLQLSVDKKSEFLKSGNKVALDVRNDIVRLVKDRIKEQKQLDSKKLVQKQNRKQRKSQIEDDDSDYAPEPVFLKKKHDSDDDFAPRTSRKSGKKKSRNGDRRLISSDSENAGGSPKKKMGNDVWAEVFLETEEKWISVDLVSGKIHCVNELYKKATHPMVYVLAWNNNNSIRDVSPRYCQNFNTVTRKLRVNNDWWEETLRPFVTQKKTARDLEEDDEFERQQLEKPLPTSIAEYKDHPLYVLKRHLLKFQAIYPPDPPPLGYVRKEAVYSRQCVYTLHSRDIWLKHAKVVKPGEKPYKIVKARPKYDRLSNTFITDQLLEVFGPWQTQDYEPPIAENGVVPRNAFGNVELFKPCMLPKKCVHLQLSGLNKIARRMNIDCASAIVGFDFHSGWSHPTYDGFVVCEEFADQLIAAWELEQEDMEKKEQEKIEKRVYGNWKKLIKGLLIRERLKAKYDFGSGEPSTSGGAGGKQKNIKKGGGAKLSTKKRRIYSDSGSASESDKN